MTILSQISYEKSSIKYSSLWEGGGQHTTQSNQLKNINV